MKHFVKIILCVLLVTGILSSQAHPRLFYGPSDVTTLQSRATTNVRYSCIRTMAVNKDEIIWEVVKEENNTQ